jgi:hypothetical protein
MECVDCGTAIQAAYDPCPFCRLSPQDSSFLRKFVKARGNIKEVQRELGVSYSVTRSMLDGLLEAMGYDPDVTRALGTNPSEKEVLAALAEGTISKDQAFRLLESR